MERVATADYVIVGAGSAGSVLAYRLSEDPNVRVIVVEAGGSERHPYIEMPAGFLKTFADPRFNWCFATEPTGEVKGRAIHFPRGGDLVYPLTLALGVTLLGHGLMTHCFKLFSASTVGIVASLQVVFSSVLAFLFLAEIPRGSFYPGAAIIISIAIYELLPTRQTGT